MRVATTIAGLLVQGLVLGHSQAQDFTLRDILHDRLRPAAADLGKRLLAGASDARLFLRVNPALDDPKQLSRMLEAAKAKGQGLPSRVIQALNGESRPTMLYDVLFGYLRRFLEVAGCTVEIIKDTRNIAYKLASENEAVLVSVDGRCLPARLAGESALALHLELRVHRLGFDVDTKRLTKVELLFRDRAHGTVPLGDLAREVKPPAVEETGPETPKPDETPEPKNPSPATLEEKTQMRKILGDAILATLTHKIAHSLWGNPRSVGSPWVGATAHRGEGRFVNASMNAGSLRRKGGGQ